MPLLLVTIAGVELENGFVLLDTATEVDIHKAAQRIRQTATHVVILHRTVQEVTVGFADSRHALLEQKQLVGWATDWSLERPANRWQYCTFEGCTLVGLDLTNTTIRPDFSPFAQLRVLKCRYLDLRDLDVSKNPQLVELDCSHNPIRTLDLSHNQALVELDCFGCKLAQLDLSNCRRLLKVDCGFNELEALELTNHQALDHLSCDHNRLRTLKLSNTLKLSELCCTSNRLTVLDLSGCPALEELHCKENRLTVLDVSGCPVLEVPNCYFDGTIPRSLQLKMPVHWNHCQMDSDFEESESEAAVAPRPPVDMLMDVKRRRV